MANLLEAADSSPYRRQSSLSRFRSRRCSDVDIRRGLEADEVQQAKFFHGRSQAFISTVVDFFQLETFVAGETIMKEGEDGDKLVFLNRGRVDVLVGPKELKLASLERGTVFGEIALLGAPKRTATIRAAEYCDCRVLAKHVFHRILKKFPDERAFFEQMGRDRMHQLEQAKTDNPSARRPVRLYSLHVEGKQRLRRSSTSRVLSSTAQKAVDKFLALRRNSIGGVSAIRGISEVAPRIRTDPCLYNSESQSPKSDDGDSSSLNAVADRAVAKYLALRRSSAVNAPRIRTDCDLPCTDDLDEATFSDEEEEMSSLPEKVVKNFLSLRRLTAPAMIASAAAEYDANLGEKVDCPCEISKKNEGPEVQTAAAPATQTVEVAPKIVEEEGPRIDFAANSIVRQAPNYDKTYPQSASASSFRRRYMGAGIRKLAPLTGQGISNAGIMDYKSLLYNVVACQL